MASSRSSIACLKPLGAKLIDMLPLLLLLLAGAASASAAAGDSSRTAAGRGGDCSLL
jgi:hypothetical protein